MDITADDVGPAVYGPTFSNRAARLKTGTSADVLYLLQADQEQDSVLRLIPLLHAQKSLNPIHSTAGMVTLGITFVIAAFAIGRKLFDLTDTTSDELNTDVKQAASVETKPTTGKVTPMALPHTGEQQPAAATGGRPSTRRGPSRPTQDILDMIKRVASSLGVDYSVLYSIAGAESDFRAGVAATGSKALGMLQFIPSTWNWLSQKVFPSLHYSADDRTDPEKSTVMAALYLRMIQRTLSAALGRQPTLGELYTGYFLGPDTAARFFRIMRDHPNAAAAFVFPREAQANPNIFYDGIRPRSFVEVLSRLSGRVGSYLRDVRALSSTSGAAAQQPAISSPDQELPLPQATATTIELETPPSPKASAPKPQAKPVVRVDKDSAKSTASGTGSATDKTYFRRNDRLYFIPGG